MESAPHAAFYRLKRGAKLALLEPGKCYRVGLHQVPPAKPGYVYLEDPVDNALVGEFPLHALDPCPEPERPTA